MSANDAVRSLESKLDEQIAKVNRGKITMIVVYAVLAIVVFAYTTWLRGLTVQALEPKGLAQFAINEAKSGLPKARVQIEKELAAQAPKLVDEGFKYLMEQIPQGRLRVEAFTLSYMDEQAKRIENDIASMVDKGLQDHAEELRNLMKELTTDKGREDFENMLYKIMSEAMAGAPDPATGEVSADVKSIRDQIAYYGDVLEQIAIRFESAQHSQEAGNVDRVERELLAALRELSRRSRPADLDSPVLDTPAGVQ